MSETCDACGAEMKVVSKADQQVLWKCPKCGDMKMVQVIKRNEVK